MDALTRKQCMGWDWEEGKSLAERILNSRQMTSKSKDWFPRSLVQFVSLLLFSFLSVFVCFFFTIGLHRRRRRRRFCVSVNFAVN